MNDVKVRIYFTLLIVTGFFAPINWLIAFGLIRLFERQKERGL